MAKADARRADKERKAAQLDERRRVVLRVYQDSDDVIAYVLGKAREAGKIPSCARGCSHCCSLEITVSRAEAEALVAWLRDTRSPAELDALADRLRAWLAWYRGDYVRLTAAGTLRGAAFLKHSPGCVFLAPDGACGVYPVRPMACRTHYVTSPPEACGPAAGPDTTVRALGGMTQATGPIAADIKRTVESQGADFEATIHLLPEWIAHLLDVDRDPWRR